MKLAALLLVLFACTSAPVPPSGRQPPVEAGAELEISVIAADGAAAASYRAGMDLASVEVGSVAGRPIGLSERDVGPHPAAVGNMMMELLDDPGPVAFVLVGGNLAVAEHRPAIQADGRPVFLLGGDVYSARALFRQVFQTAIPAAWQARVLAKYLARDRGYREVLVTYDGQRFGYDPQLRSDRDVHAIALREEGLRVQEAPLDLGELPLAAFRRVDAVLALGPFETAERVARGLKEMRDPPQLALPSESLRTDAYWFPPGTIAPGPYAWASWADAIPRVRTFRRALEIESRGEIASTLEDSDGPDLLGFEQEGYDAIHVLADALERTGGRTGEPLIRALERNRPEGSTFSALPVVLGPDDHTLADESWIGLYAVPGPDEEREVPTTPWRPIIRTFTYDGERTIFREEDRTAFFPFWEPNRPSPYYYRSVLGIVTGPEDPLH